MTVDVLVVDSDNDHFSVVASGCYPYNDNSRK